MSALPSPLKSPVPIACQLGGGVPTIAWEIGVIPSISQIAASPLILPQDVRFAVAVEIRRWRRFEIDQRTARAVGAETEMRVGAGGGQVELRDRRGTVHQGQHAARIARAGGEDVGEIDRVAPGEVEDCIRRHRRAVDLQGGGCAVEEGDGAAARRVRFLPLSVMFPVTEPVVPLLPRVSVAPELMVVPPV